MKYWLPTFRTLFLVGAPAAPFQELCITAVSTQLSGHAAGGAKHPRADIQVVRQLVQMATY